MADNSESSQEQEGEPQGQQQGQMPNGFSPSEEALERTEVQVKREHVFFFLAGLAAAIGLGGLIWSAADYYFTTKRYDRIADRVVEGIGAISEVAETLEAHN
jgi:hypothetical protein